MSVFLAGARMGSDRRPQAQCSADPQTFATTWPVLTPRDKGCYNLPRWTIAPDCGIVATAPQRDLRINPGSLVKKAPRFVGSVLVGWLILSCAGGDRLLGPPPPTGVASAIATDINSESFTGTAGPLSGSWTQQAQPGTLDKNGSGLGKGSVNGKDLFVVWNAITFGNDQYSQVRIAGVLMRSLQYAKIS